jgi:nucleoside-diphosphate-sugar epimerase
VEPLKQVLVTGAAGFIGRHVTAELLRKGYRVTALVRPGSKYRIPDGVERLECDLTNIIELKELLRQHRFDGIFHIGALRGGRKFPKRDYYRANVDATEQLALHARETGARMIFCSSVGVFGAIPLELPANNLTTRQSDNYYHYTKIEAEQVVLRQVMDGLHAVIIRPSITYGPGDFGFPRTLVKLVDKTWLPIADRPVRIHMTEVNTLTTAFVNAFEMDIPSGNALIVADRAPVLLSTLVDYIRAELGKPPYPRNRCISRRWFDLWVHIARKTKQELWVSRFELISRSWFYDVSDAERLLGVVGPDTIPAFKSVIDDYRIS